MVGVPGRSKGCNTCRKRKIRCSQERPECTQCIRSNRKCLGYERERTFIVFNAPTSQNLAGQAEVGKDSDPENRTSESCSAFSLGSDSACKSPELFSSQPSHSLAAVDLTDSSLYTSPVHGLYCSSMRDQMLGSWFSAYQKEQLGGNRNWLSDVPAFTHNRRVVESSAFALCLAGIGRKSGDTAIVRESLALYTQGLTDLQKALYNPRTMYADETLAACMLLTMYEVTECPDRSPRAFLSHYYGVSRLVQLRGPKAHTDGLGHAVFLHFRSIASFLSLESKTTFLAEPEWNSVPFSGSKTRYDALVDLLLQAPAILKRADDLDDLPPDERLQSAIIMFQQCVELEKRLHKFHDTMQTDNHNSPTFWPARSPSSAATKSPLEAVDLVLKKATMGSYEFPDLTTAVNMILLWSMQVLLWSGLVQLYILINTLQRGLGLEYSIPGWNQRFTHFIVPAQNVIQSAAYFLKNEPSARMAVAPLTMVVDVLMSWPDSGYEKEVSAAHDMLYVIMTRGMKLVKYLSPFGNRLQVSPNYITEVSDGDS